MALADAGPDVKRKDVHEHLAQMRIVEAMAKTVAMCNPLSHVIVKLPKVTTLRESMKLANALNVALIGTSFVLNVEHAPEFESIIGFYSCDVFSSWMEGVSDHGANEGVKIAGQES